MDSVRNKVRYEETAVALTGKANFGLSVNTWKKYQTTINHIDQCRQDTGVDMDLPFNSSKTLEFVGWMEARGLKSNTMSSYLSGVRMYHITCGYNDPTLREPIVKMILKGQDNWDKLQDRINGKRGRLPVTIKMMKLMKRNLIKVGWSVQEKRLFWSVATLCWYVADQEIILMNKLL